MAMLEGLDVMTTPIAIVANFTQLVSIVLAASPPMKERFKMKKKIDVMFMNFSEIN